MPVFNTRTGSFADERPLLEVIRAARKEVGPSKNFGVDPLVISLQAMLHSLDPYSGVLTSKEDRRAAGFTAVREGFGLDVPEEEGDRVCIREVLLGSPAQKAGLRVGDEIVAVRDSDGRKRNVKDSLNLLNGRTSLRKPQLGSLSVPEPIAITYRRPGEDGERRATLEWHRFRPESVFGTARRRDNSWNYWIDGANKIAHVRIGNVLESTPDELSEVLDALRRDGMRGLILDLRACPGGALTGSVRTAELFLGEGTIATVEYRNQPQDVYRSTKDEKNNEYPMVVLISEDSTGGAEMIAAALQDHHRAVLVGQRTHGKGNVQKLRNLGPVGLKVTSGVLMRPSGKPLHRFPDSKDNDPWGVLPDPGHEFRLSAEARSALRTWWEQHTLRPGSSSRRLPLDDPLADVQRNAAVETLEKMLHRDDDSQAE
jgi:carboxyl-terminal processing protease